MNSLQLCANSLGQEGYCTYENQQCQVLTSCSQLKNFNECSIFNKSCQFVTSSGKCEQLYCSSYTNSNNCTYVFENINKANIQICVWNDVTKTCSTATYLIQQTYENCYLNTGGTYHWSSPQTTQGACVSCSINWIKPKNICSCTLLNQIECSLSKPVCKLNQNNECVKSQCNEIFDSLHCSQQNECMWNQNQCVTFTKCTDLSGTTNLDCVAQSLQCQATQNGICQPASSLNSCEKYSQSQCKLGKLGSEGFCYFNETKNACQVISSCDSVNNIQYCEKLNPACKWSYNFNKCVPYQCQDYRYEEECINVIVNLQDPQIELCVWQNYKCVPFVDTYYKFDDAICYVKSDHTYRWVKEDKFGVRCQQCLQAYLINIIAIVLLIYI
ncbi:unnamed protein product [Paramecium primaurelia]|uniref:Uncharacterized protein n=1 Tax=Paramecium primaurelia TaxID=5886 RepID=A0A8S1NNW1_PARPR|nr:unnamed protein product [Paramecium primaurelia]